MNASIQQNGNGYEIIYNKRTKALSTLEFTDNKYSNDNSSKEFSSLMGNSLFNYVKPTELVKKLILTGMQKDDIVMDFFSGSATTAHAVMQLNAEDGGHRKFILVQLPELTYEGKKETVTDSKGNETKRYVIDETTGFPVVAKDSEAHKAGFNTICDIGEERIIRAGKKIKEETGADIDYGFRCFRVDSSNMKEVYYSPSHYSQMTLEDYAENIKPDRTDMDLLFQVMLEIDIELSAKIEEKVIAGKKVFSIENGYLIACFDKDINDDTVKAIAEEKPVFAVFRNDSMKSDSVYTNFDEIFKEISPKTERKVL